MEPTRSENSLHELVTSSRRLTFEAECWMDKNQEPLDFLRAKKLGFARYLVATKQLSEWTVKP